MAWKRAGAGRWSTSRRTWRRRRSETSETSPHGKFATRIRRSETADSGMLAAAETYLKEQAHDGGTSPRRHEEGRFHSHLRWHAAEVECQRAALCGVGGVSPQGLARRPQPAVCFAD